MAYSQDQFDWQGYLAAHPSSNLQQGTNSTKDAEGARAYQDYVAGGSTWLNSTDQSALNAQTTNTPASGVDKVTPTTPTAVGQQNIQDYSGSLAANPGQASNPGDGTSLVDATKNQTGTAAQINPTDPNLSVQGSVGSTASTAAAPVKTDAHTADTTATTGAVQSGAMTGAQGSVSQNSQVTAAQENVGAIANGTDANGVGKALQTYASQNMSNIIDTSTSSGKLLAAQLGDGNYVDSKATTEGQLALLQQQFVDPTTGQPKIPAWAASTARNVSQIMAFSGMTGTAATAAMSQALMEASLPIATSDAQFFQTLTTKNLDNKQQSVINTANTLAKFEQSNLDNRQQAAVQNAQSFMAMDLKNLDNNQQAAVINNQAYIQSIMSDANAKNVASQFNATAQNTTDQFYATLGEQVATFNAAQLQSTSQYNATMEDSRQKYNATNAYNIAVSNANWRQATQLQDDQQAFQAATTDVKTATDMQTQALNEIWDRSNSLLDYAFQSSQNDKNRAATLAAAQLAASQSKSNANMTALGSLAGTFIGSKAGSETISAAMTHIFG
jgi:hypothetical protein